MNRLASTPRAFWNCRPIGWGVAALLLLAGCQPELQTYYGQRKGPMSDRSVNGTAAFSEMFEHRGHTVFSWSRLSPRLRKRADVIVWFPNDFKPPSRDVREWLERWLSAAPHRTLIYVGRDFDAAPWYWATAAPLAQASQASEYQVRQSLAQADFRSERGSLPASEDCDWFTLDSQPASRRVRTLQGEPEWLDGVDPAQAAIHLYSRLVPPDEAEVLLRSEKDVLVSRQPVGQSQLIVVANGSFLLNAMLVNHEHRKLANQLITEVGPPAQNVCFLESYSGGPTIHSDDSWPGMPTGMEIFHIWPTNWILLHLAIVGILFCFSRYPIFGRPRQREAEAPSDFGRHIHALGDLLERSGDTAYAYARLMQYRQAKAEVGKRQAPTPSPNPEPPTRNPDTPFS